MRVLFTNAGRRTYIIDYALKIKNIKVYISETDRTSPAALYRNINIFFTEKVEKGSKKYLNQIYKFVVDNKIKKIIPLSDFDLLILSKNKKKFLDSGCDIIVSDYKTIKNSINKKLMYEFCLKNNINTPKSFFSLNDFKNTNNKFLIKKIKGSGSKGMRLFDYKNDLRKINFNNYFIQQKINGTEYGVDIFLDFKKNFFKICIKEKLSMRAGETDKSLIVDDKTIETFCKKINDLFLPYGNLDCDLIKDRRGNIFLLDLNPRFGGGYPSTHEAGFKYLDYLLNPNTLIPKKPVVKVVSKGISIFSKKK